MSLLLQWANFPPGWLLKFHLISPLSTSGLPIRAKIQLLPFRKRERERESQLTWEVPLVAQTLTSLSLFEQTDMISSTALRNSSSVQDRQQPCMNKLSLLHFSGANAMIEKEGPGRRSKKFVKHKSWILSNFECCFVQSKTWKCKDFSGYNILFKWDTQWASAVYVHAQRWIIFKKNISFIWTNTAIAKLFVILEGMMDLTSLLSWSLKNILKWLQLDFCRNLYQTKMFVCEIWCVGQDNFATTQYLKIVFWRTHFFDNKYCPTPPTLGLIVLCANEI